MGSVSVAIVPAALLVKVTLPPCRRARCRAIGSPSPGPRSPAVPGMGARAVKSNSASSWARGMPVPRSITSIAFRPALVERTDDRGQRRLQIMRELRPGAGLFAAAPLQPFELLAEPRRAPLERIGAAPAAVDLGGERLAQRFVVEQRLGRRALDDARHV